MTLDLLRKAVRRHTGSEFNPSMTGVPGLTLLRSACQGQTNHHINKPALCIVAQGAKSTMFGDSRFDYHAGQALVVSVELPAFSTIVEASSSEPYMGVIIESTWPSCVKSRIHSSSQRKMDARRAKACS